MSKKASVNNSKPAPAEGGISRITVSGYKSICNEQSIEIKPLTILAGANSSGKTSIMQPLLLLKQTLEATYDPGPLLLDGPNVRFTSAVQLFSHLGSQKPVDLFVVEIVSQSGSFIKLNFEPAKNGLQIKEMVAGNKDAQTALTFRLGMSHKMILSQMDSLTVPSEKTKEAIELIFSMFSKLKIKLSIIRDRCFLKLAGAYGKGDISLPPNKLTDAEELSLREMIHLPGLRGNPQRNFPMTAVGTVFPGAFQEYAASIIAEWQAKKDTNKLDTLSHQLADLGLTWKITARIISDTQVALQVGRLAHPQRGGQRDLVNIADVGFGVSQVLPVLVALLVAKPGQLVYIEEPEIHLHPRAQSAMAEVLADAARRGVRVVIETHSQLLLLGIQTLVAKGSLSPDLVKLHWFQRGNDGGTKVTSTDLDEAGAFGDWPEDFAEVALEAESRYLDAAESQQTIN